jgi:hypothetical protein
VQVGRIVKLVVYPDVREFGEIVSARDRQALISRTEEIKAVVAKFPASRSYLDPSINRLNEELAHYDSGKVKTDGVWVSKQAFVKSEAMKLASLLKAEIARAKQPSSLDLEADPKFIGLKELAEANPDAKRLAMELSAQFEGLVRAEKRSVLVARLSRSGTSLDEAEDTLDQPTAQSEEDPKSGKSRFGIQESQRSKQRRARPKRSQDCLSAISYPRRRLAAQDLARTGKADFFDERHITRFATNPPIPLVSAVRRAVAACAAGADFQKLKPILRRGATWKP